MCYTFRMAYLEYHRLIIALALAAVRIGAAFMVCPAFGEAMIMGTARRVAILAFAVLAVPHVLATMPPGEPVWGMLAVVGVKEVVVTLGSYGSPILADGQFHSIPAYEPHARVDATGSGDT